MEQQPYRYTVRLYDRDDRPVYDGYFAGTYGECKKVGQRLVWKRVVEGAVRSKPLLIDRARKAGRH